MSFSLYCLIISKSRHINLEILESQLSEYFSRIDGFKQVVETHPFDSSKKNLRLSWGAWPMLVFYEFGEDVREDSKLIAKYAEPARRQLISSVDRRIVVRFGDDPELIYTDHIMIMYEFLENMSDLIIFDQKRNVFIN